MTALGRFTLGVSIRITDPKVSCNTTTIWAARSPTRPQHVEFPSPARLHKTWPSTRPGAQAALRLAAEAQRSPARGDGWVYQPAAPGRWGALSLSAFSTCAGVSSWGECPVSVRSSKCAVGIAWA